MQNVKKDNIKYRKRLLHFIPLSLIDNYFVCKKIICETYDSVIIQYAVLNYIIKT